MAIYADAHLVVDTDYLVCARAGDGHGEHDGLYAVCLLLMVGGRPRREYVEYPTEAARSAAMLAIGALLHAEDAAMSHEACEAEAGDSGAPRTDIGGA